jgi:hypothetical protein
VLADDSARAEVAAPITSTVMSTFGVPPEQRPIVADQVDRLLRDPVGARSFVDPFAGSWARMLGEDDPRPAEFDLAPLLDRFVATAPPGTTEGLAIPDRLPVTGVPLPRTQLTWMADVRSAIEMTVVPLALVAGGLFAVAFALGDRARVLRRAGVWAVLAGASWVVIPPFVVWLTRRWAPGADSVASAALGEATAGLLPAAIALTGIGVTAFALSFVVVPTADRAPTRRGNTTRSDAVPRAPVGPARPQRSAPVAAVGTAPSARSVDATAEMPAVTEPVRRGPAPPLEPVDDTGDELWDFYTSS